MAQKLLIVDDEVMLTDLLKRHFSDAGYTVLPANTHRRALELLKMRPDLIILDINMPDVDGLTFCKEIRSHVVCPILFLTARITEEDKLVGLRTGGDDYITKPISLAELTARVEAHLRREQRAHAASQLVTAGGLLVDLSNRTVSFQGVNIPLTKKEFDIIELLITNANLIFDKERIYEAVWGLEAGGDNSVVKEHIRKIRAKLSEAAGQDYIETVWGMGYKWKQE